VIIAPIVVQYQSATGATLYMVWAVGLALVGLLAWAVVRSKAPAPSMAAEIEVPKAKKKSKKK
jgi:hypothetical protein